MPEDPTRPFLPGEAEEWSQRRWRQAARVTRGVRSTQPPVSVEDYCRHLVRVLPSGTAFSHRTAAHLWRLPVPAHLETVPGRIEVLQPGDRGRVERRGCLPHRGVERRVVEQLRGLPVSSMADTWLDLAALRETTADDLVVLGDAVAARLPSQRLADDPVARAVARATAEDGKADATWTGHDRSGLAALQARLEARGHERGTRKARDALSSVRPGVRSPMETRTRLLVVRAGLPEPDVNRPLLLGSGAVFTPDLVWWDARVAVEYQGDHHASLRQRSEDAARRELAQDEGWRVFEAFAADVLQGARSRTFLARLAQALGVAAPLT